MGVPSGVSSREAGILKDLYKQLKQQRVVRFRGIGSEATTGPETASGRNWAARASWEAPGVHLGAVSENVPESVRKEVPKQVDLRTSCWVAQNY